MPNIKETYDVIVVGAGHASCYWRELVPGGWRECEPVVRAPEDMYEK